MPTNPILMNTKFGKHYRIDFTALPSPLWFSVMSVFPLSFQCRSRAGFSFELLVNFQSLPFWLQGFEEVSDVRRIFGDVFIEECGKFQYMSAPFFFRRTEELSYLMKKYIESVRFALSFVSAHIVYGHHKYLPPTM